MKTIACLAVLVVLGLCPAPARAEDPTHPDAQDVEDAAEDANDRDVVIPMDVPAPWDAGPRDTGPVCPASAPTPGSACGTSGTGCYYPSACGVDHYFCQAGTWLLTSTACDAGASCPPYRPATGSGCADEGQSCSYPVSCEYYLYQCAGGTWRVQGYVPCDSGTWPWLPVEDGPHWEGCHCAAGSPRASGRCWTVLLGAGLAVALRRRRRR